MAVLTLLTVGAGTLGYYMGYKEDADFTDPKFQENLRKVPFWKKDEEERGAYNELVRLQVQQKAMLEKETAERQGKDSSAPRKLDPRTREIEPARKYEMKRRQSAPHTREMEEEARKKRDMQRQLLEVQSEIKLPTDVASILKLHPELDSELRTDPSATTFRGAVRD